MVRYWAAARSAAGTATEEVQVSGEVTLAEVVAHVLARHAQSARGDRLAQVLAMCSVLVGDEPVGTRAHEAVVVRPGQSVEFLPPFAGG